MTIQSLELSDFRNYEYLKLEFDEKINIICGANGQGKTNILEAIVLCATSRSHRGSKDREMIRFGCEEAHIRANLRKAGRGMQIDLHLRKQKSKGIAVNRLPLQRAAQLIGVCNVVVFSPEDLRIIKSGPSERRNFMNQTLCQTDPVYLHDLSQYHKALRQRNQLLKEIGTNPELEETLDVWDLQLVRCGKRVLVRREQFIRELNRMTEMIHARLTGGSEQIRIIYERSTTEDRYAEELGNSRERDLRFQTTHVGPHRDDLKVLVNDVDMRAYGSQGQQRTCALSMKLSAIDLIRETLQEEPVLLLDDVLSELDTDRQQDLLQFIDGNQTIITCTGYDEFLQSRFHPDRIFEAADGVVTMKRQEA